MAEATFIVDEIQGWTERLRRDQEGFQGYRHYKVDATDPTEVLLASGLPQIGQAWSAELPLVAARSHDPVRRLRGHTIVRVDYDSPRASLFDPGGASHTELQVGTVVATAYQGALPSGVPDGVQIEDGAPKEEGTLEARVSAYFSVGAFLPLANWLTLVGWLNSNPITLPKVGFTANQFALAPDQALYLGFEGPTQQGDRVVVTHRLRLSPSFEVLEAIVTDDNRVVSTVPRRIYGSRVFAGLW